MLRQTLRTLGVVDYREIDNDGREFDYISWNKFGLVSIDLSRMKQAGNGLIADIDFEAGDCLVGYEGRVKRYDPTLSTLTTSHDLSIPDMKEYVIRGFHTEKDFLRRVDEQGNSRLLNAGSMANDAEGSRYYGHKPTHSNNSRKEAIDRECVPTYIRDLNTNIGKRLPKLVYLIADRDIPKGDEITWSYDCGQHRDGYWSTITAHLR